MRKSSLLAVGITGVKGRFSTGDFIQILSGSGNQIGRGISAFSSKDISLIKGVKSDKLSGILNRKCATEVIHKDKMMIFTD